MRRGRRGYHGVRTADDAHVHAAYRRLRISLWYFFSIFFAFLYSRGGGVSMCVDGMDRVFASQFELFEIPDFLCTGAVGLGRELNKTHFHITRLAGQALYINTCAGIGTYLK